MTQICLTNPSTDPGTMEHPQTPQNWLFLLKLVSGVDMLTAESGPYLAPLTSAGPVAPRELPTPRTELAKSQVSPRPAFGGLLLCLGLKRNSAIQVP